MTEKDILNLIEKDKWMMNILQTAEELNLPDWIIGAGFVRNKVWDYLHGYNNPQIDTADIDLVYFDLKNLNEDVEKNYKNILKEKLDVNWSCKNEARMHLVNNLPPYTSSEDAISQWPETATAIGVKLKNGKLKLIASYGIDDLINLIVRRSPKFADIDKVKERVKQKKWLEKWPKLKLQI